jgi:multiple sugar transport system permease protein
MSKAAASIKNGLMTVLGLIFLSPVVLMVLTSFKPESEVLNPESAIPKHWILGNFQHVLGWSEEAPFVRWLLNSVFISTSTTLLVLTISSMAAYAITRLKVPGGSVFLGVIVGAMMIPGQLFLVPVYLLLSKLHWLDTPAALIVPATAGGFGVFMLSQFMRSVPESLEEAAILDGCSTLGVFSNVILPLCGPAIATLGIFTFIGSWNDFLGPLVFMDSIRDYTLPVGIALYQASYYTEYGLTLATAVLGTVPLIIVFLLFQRYIVESMSSTGLKD